MPVFVVLSVSIALMIVAVTVVVGVRLARAVSTMTQGVSDAVERLQPLVDELGEELAVTQTEVEHLGERARRLRAASGRLHLDASD